MAFGCGPAFEYGSAAAQAALAADAGSPTPAPNRLPRAWLGLHCAGGDSGLQLVLTSSSASCAEAAALVHGGRSTQSFMTVALSGAGEDFEGSGQLCEGGSCRRLPVQVQVQLDHAPGADTASGSYQLSEDGAVIAEGSFTSTTCAYDQVAATRRAVVERLTISQAVDIPLYEAGAIVSERNAPVIADRPALVRVFLRGEGEFAEEALSAELRLTQPEAAEQRFEAPLQLSEAAGSYAELDSSLNFELPTGALQLGGALQLSLYEADGCPAVVQEEAALAPISLDVQEDLSMTVLFIPITYKGKPVPLTQERVDEYRANMLAHYPISDRSLHVELSDTPLIWDEEIESLNWGPLLGALEARRAEDGPSRETFYYGVFEGPDGFCDPRCMHGLAKRNLNGGAYRQISLGLHEASGANDTFIHEIAHNMGRRHTSCHSSYRDPPANQDPDYPYTDGIIGVWGTDLFEEEPLLHSDKDNDFMGYCGSRWISDYTYRALYERLQYIHQPVGSSLSDSTPRTWLRVTQVGARLSWDEPIELSEQPGGEAVAVAYLDADGALIAEDTAYRGGIADLEDTGMFKIPPAPEGSAAIQLAGYGVVAIP